MISETYTSQAYTDDGTACHTLDLQIARQCAPLLAGVKISNFLITHKTNRDYVQEMFHSSPIKVRCIYQDEEKLTLFLYKEDEMLLLLEKPEAEAFMDNEGYQGMNLSMILEHISYRYTAYMKERRPFPHEIGILLGYPVADVAGFMGNEGKNFLYLGYWKVYSDLPGALDTFHRYRRAKEIITHLVRCGRSIHSILTEYQSGDLNWEESRLAAV